MVYWEKGNGNRGSFLRNQYIMRSDVQVYLTYLMLKLMKLKQNFKKVVILQLTSEYYDIDGRGQHMEIGLVVRLSPVVIMG